MVDLIYGLVFGIWDLGLGKIDLGFWTWALIFGTWDDGLEVYDLGFNI